MIRLLWKEWVEIRLFLLGLLAAPVFSMLVLQDQYGFCIRDGLGNVNGSEPDSHWIVLILLAIWGASRFPEEMKRGLFSVLRLPIKRGRILAAKFLPGLIAVLLVPAWCVLMICLIAPHRFGGYPETAWLLSNALNLLGCFLVAYCLAFAVSLYSNLATGALFGIIGALAIPDLLESYVATPIRKWFAATHIHPAMAHGMEWRGSPMLTQGYLQLFLQALFLFVVLTGAFTSLHRSVTPSPKRRAMWGIGVSSCILSLAMVLFFAFVPRTDEAYRPDFLPHPSPDGQQVAMIHSDKPATTNVHVEIVDLTNQRKRTTLHEPFIGVIAWTPDSRSLFVEVRAELSGRGRIVRIDEDGRITTLASLPPERKERYGSGLGECGRATTDGRFLVLTRNPKYVDGVDVWSIDLQTNTPRVVAANTSGWPRIDWGLLATDSLVLEESRGSFVEIALDGSGEKRRWEARCED